MSVLLAAGASVSSDVLHHVVLNLSLEREYHDRYKEAVALLLTSGSEVNYQGH